MSNTASRTRTLAECAMMIAVSTVLSMIPIIKMPFGGSVTLLSMLPLVLVSYRHKLRWGLLTGFVHALIQMLLEFYAPPAGTVIAYIGVILLDYVLAFTVLGSAYLFAKPFKNRWVGVVVGAVAVCFLRFLCSFISGAWLWGSYQESYAWAEGLNVWVYSLIYNANYMLPELILTALGAGLIYKIAPRLFQKQ